MNVITTVLEALGRLARDPALVLLLAWLVAASVIDWRTRRIPNALTASGALVALALGAVQGEAPAAGLADALLGLLVGLTLPMPLYMLRVLGAGDVKLLAMAGAFLGPGLAWQAVLGSFIAGGLGALAFAISQRSLWQLLLNSRDLVHATLLPGVSLSAARGALPTLGRFPFASSICLGTTGLLLLRQITSS